MTLDIHPPFGTHALPPAREAWRLRAARYADTRVGRLLISRCRKKALAGEQGPFDVQIEAGLNARLYPTTNRCEKRVFAGPQIWDASERAALKTRIEQQSDRPFIFLDVGANVGLYSLYVYHYAMAANRNARIVAIEPAMEICRRLEDNIAANKADIQVIRAAVSDTPGTGRLGGGGQNRGETHLVEAAGDDDCEAVVIDTLPRICRAQGISHIDAMKVDVEGHDLRALTAFFEDAPTRLHPHLLIIETGRGGNAALVTLCEKYDYRIAPSANDRASAKAGLNTIMEKHHG